MTVCWLAALHRRRGISQATGAVRPRRACSQCLHGRTVLSPGGNPWRFDAMLAGRCRELSHIQAKTHEDASKRRDGPRRRLTERERPSRRLNDAARTTKALGPEHPVQARRNRVGLSDVWRALRRASGTCASEAGGSGISGTGASSREAAGMQDLPGGRLLQPLLCGPVHKQRARQAICHGSHWLVSTPAGAWAKSAHDDWQSALTLHIGRPVPDTVGISSMTDCSALAPPRADRPVP